MKREGITSAAHVDQMESDSRREVAKQTVYARAIVHILGVKIVTTSLLCCSQSTRVLLTKLKGHETEQTYLGAGNSYPKHSFPYSSNPAPRLRSLCRAPRL